MAKWGKMDYKAFEKMAKNFEEAVKNEVGQQLIEAILKEVGKKVLAKTKKRTPVGDYGTYEYTLKKGKNKGKNVKRAKARYDGHVGGTLRKGWYITGVRKNVNTHFILIYNNVEYASFVEYGHRKRNNKGWVEGRFMLTISMKEVERSMQQIADKHTIQVLKQLFN